MNPSRLFGTDGIRARANTPPLMPESVMRLGRSVGRWLLERPRSAERGIVPPPRVLIARDPRPSGAAIERSFAAGLSSCGVGLWEAGILPTPGVSVLTLIDSFDLGVVVSASHNPFRDNGLKFFGRGGFKLGEIAEREIEELFHLPDGAWRSPPPESIGECRAYPDGTDRYLDFLRSIANQRGVALAGDPIVIDCANGAACGVAPRLFAGLGASVFAIHADADGIRINDGCGALHPESLRDEVKRRRAILGVGLDGDGDRAIFVDEEGEIRDGDSTLAICARRLQDSGRLRGNRVVATVMSNLGLERALAARGIALARTPVGDRCVLDEMRRDGSMLGGEQSGHVIFMDDAPTGDGLVTAIEVLAAMGAQGQPLSSLADCMRRFPQGLRGVRVRERLPLDRAPAFEQAVQTIESRLCGEGRIVVRYSGTELTLRLMVEAADERSVTRTLDELESAARAHLPVASA